MANLYHDHAETHYVYTMYYDEVSTNLMLMASRHLPYLSNMLYIGNCPATITIIASIRYSCALTISDGNTVYYLHPLSMAMLAQSSSMQEMSILAPTRFLRRDPKPHPRNSIRI